MAQKVHPTGFRVGITKTQKATWFAPFGKFHKVLRSDSHILKIWETTLEQHAASGSPRQIAIQAQITDLHIERRLNLLQLTITAGCPNVLLADDCSLFEEFKNRINEFDNKLSCRIKLKKLSHPARCAKFIASQLAEKMERRMPMKRAITTTIEILKSRNAVGYKIQIAGRLNGADIARAYSVSEGRLPSQTLAADIDYASQRAITKFGVLGIKIWIFTGELSNILISAK